MFVKSQLYFIKERNSLRIEGALSTALFRRVLMPPHPTEKLVHKSYQGIAESVAISANEKTNASNKTSAYNVLMVGSSIGDCGDLMQHAS